MASSKEKGKLVAQTNEPAKEKKSSQKQKPKILRWRGVLSDSPRTVRLVVATVLAVAGIALTYTQLGFVAIDLPDGSVGYLIVLLQVVALGSLLLGTLPGTALGIIAGGVLLLHSRVLPLDHYELTFITPVTSVVMLATTGFLLGILFAFALRKNPSQVKRVIYLTIICFFVSGLYAFVFIVNMMFALIMEIVNTFGLNASEDIVQAKVFETVTQLGDINVLGGGTGLLMALLCVIGDFLARKAQAHRKALGLRTVFGMRLGVTVALAFMLTSAVSFAVTTVDELWDAEWNMKHDASYLVSQMEEAGVRSRTLEEFAVSANIETNALDNETLNALLDVIDENNLLSGYASDEHGIVCVLYNNVVLMTNDDRIAQYSPVDTALGMDEANAIEESLQDGHMKRLVRGGAAQSSEEFNGTAIQGIAGEKPHIAYLYAERETIEYGEDFDVETTIVIIQPSDKVFEKRSSIMTWMTLSSFALLLAVFAIVFQLVSRMVVRRIDEENEALARITEGNLDTRASAGGSREFESLSEGINVTVDALKGWIAEAETRMDAELTTARTIQESALPSTFPPFPNIPRFDIYASMNAAKQVGGDFYDFFLVGDDCDAKSGKLGFVVADVSGKGVPAALFMMKAKALLRDYVGSGMELGEAVAEANRQLVEGNDAGMFVTAWVGLLDYGTGHIDYVNAGHNPPLLWTRADNWQWMRQKSGVPLGLFEMPYQAHAVDCMAGDMLLLYTDGVTEAFDVDANLYGEERLLAVAKEGYRMHPRELLEAVRASVAEHAKGAEQSDDITILTLEVGVPPEVTATLEVPARIDELVRVNDFLHAELERRLCPQRVQNQLDIAVEELFVNVCHYAYPDATPDNPGRVRIQRTYDADPASIIVDIIDEGIPYNPLAKPDAVTPDNIEDVPIGGLGILMAKKCTDEMRYERVGESNVVTIVKKW